MKPIKGFKNYAVTKDGRIYNLRFGRYINPTVQKNGYVKFGGFDDNKKRRTYQVHRAVAEAFIPNPDNKLCVNHIDGNPSNNNVKNLEWCTHKENKHHAIYVTKTANIGQKSPFATTLERDARIIYKLKDRIPRGEIAEMFDVSEQVVRKIHTKLTWKHIHK